MHCAYVGIVTNRGLELFHREGEHSARFLSSRLRRCRYPRAFCVWFVMDAVFEDVLTGLLRAGHPDGAWAFLQDAAREHGVVLPDGDHFTQFDESA